MATMSSAAPDNGNDFVSIGDPLKSRRGAPETRRKPMSKRSKNSPSFIV
jgi:hypothetical protein